jgi:hypothetical protein
MTFNYFYLNGINTPYNFDDPNQRGSYLWDRKMIKGNLLDLGPQVGPGQTARRPPNIKIADERDVFQIESYNFSGTTKNDCKNPGLPQLVRFVCDKLDDWRARGIGGMAPGDIVECFIQAAVSSGEVALFAGYQSEIDKLNSVIRGIYRRESGQPNQAKEVNFFIVIGHSQGNFFAEGIAYRLFLDASSGDADAKAIFENRLGVISLASPSSYESLPKDFIDYRIKHFTRKDDGIEALGAIPGPGKKPWKANLPQLWPWPPGQLERDLQLWDPSRKAGDPFYSPFLATMGLSPPNPVCTKNPTRTECDSALYTPLMNSHLLDNYLADPPLSVGGMPVNEEVGQVLQLAPSTSVLARSPSTSDNGVLSQIRAGLRDLKSQLVKSYRTGG